MRAVPASTKGEHGEAGSRAPHVSKATCDRTCRLRILVFNFQHKSPLGILPDGDFYAPLSACGFWQIFVICQVLVGLAQEVTDEFYEGI